MGPNDAKLVDDVFGASLDWSSSRQTGLGDGNIIGHGLDRQTKISDVDDDRLGFLQKPSVFNHSTSVTNINAKPPLKRDTLSSYLEERGIYSDPRKTPVYLRDHKKEVERSRVNSLFSSAGSSGPSEVSDNVNANKKDKSKPGNEHAYITSELFSVLYRNYNSF